MPFPNREYPQSLCDHPEVDLSFVRDEPVCRWVGRCAKCGRGPGPGDGGGIIRTDEQIANGEAPMVSMVDQWIAWRKVLVLV